MICGVFVVNRNLDDWQRWSFTTIEGGNVKEEEVEAARSQLDPRTFRQEFEASFENLTGLVAVSFSDENIDKEVEDLTYATSCYWGWILTLTLWLESVL